MPHGRQVSAGGRVGAMGSRATSAWTSVNEDVAPEARIVGAMHLTHPPGTERGEDFVGT